jgi:hypothetical protein
MLPTELYMPTIISIAMPHNPWHNTLHLSLAEPEVCSHP